MSPEAFVRARTAIAHAPLVPEIRLHLATEITPIWQASEAWLERHGLEPPFWAFAWPGAQALARYVLDRPALVQGRTVLDFAAGGGLAAIACARAAGTAQASEIDPTAIAAIAVNAALNGVAVTTLADDVVGQPTSWDLVLCGDVCYEAPMTAHILPWLRHLARDTEVWLADPGRAYLPRDGLQALGRYDVPTTLELEDRVVRPTTVYRLLPG